MLSEKRRIALKGMNEKENTRVLGGTTAVRLLEVRLGPTSLYTFPIYIHIYEGVQGMDTATRVRMYIPYLPVTCFLQPSAPKGEFWGGGGGGGADDTPLQDFTHVFSYQRSNLVELFFSLALFTSVYDFFASFSLTDSDLKAIGVIDSFLLIPTTGYLVVFCGNVTRCLTRLFLP